MRGAWRGDCRWAVGTGACGRAPPAGAVRAARYWRGPPPRLRTGAVATAAAGSNGRGTSGGSGGGGGGGGVGGGGRWRGAGASSLEAAVDRLTAIHLAVADTRGHHARVSADLLTVQSHSLLLEAMTEDMETMATLLLEGAVGGMGPAEVARAAATADGVAASLRLMAADMAGAGKDGTAWAAYPPLPSPDPGIGAATAWGCSSLPFPTAAAAKAAPPSPFPALVPPAPAAVAARLCDAVDAFRLYRRRYLRPVCDDTVELLRQSAAALDQGDTVLAQTAAALDGGDTPASAQTPRWTATRDKEGTERGGGGRGAPDGAA